MYSCAISIIKKAIGEKHETLKLSTRGIQPSYAWQKSFKLSNSLEDIIFLSFFMFSYS